MHREQHHSQTNAISMQDAYGTVQGNITLPETGNNVRQLSLVTINGELLTSSE